MVAAPEAAEGLPPAAIARRPRASDWASARRAVGDATGYRGAIAVRGPEFGFAGAASFTTPAGEFVGARTGVIPFGAPTTVSDSPSGAPIAAPVGRAASARRAASAPPAEWVASTSPAPGRAGATPVARRAAPSAPALTMFGEPVVDTLPAGAAPSRAGAGAPRRAALDSTVLDLARPAGTEGGSAANAPTWATRAEGRPLIRSAQGLFDSLARATTAEQVVAVIAQRAGGFEGAVPLTEPMREVVQAIRAEMRDSAMQAPEFVAQPVHLATRAPDVQSPPATVIRGARVQGVPSSASVRRGSVRPVRSTALATGAGGADDRVSKLVRRLTDLIHLAEDQRRLSEAQSQVRMAEDTAAARAEGSAPLGQSAGGGVKLDIETFTREVLEVVGRELESRRERRTEDGDESNWW
jgi:hypothetical protein